MALKYCLIEKDGHNSIYLDAIKTNDTSFNYLFVNKQTVGAFLYFFRGGIEKYNRTIGEHRSLLRRQFLVHCTLGSRTVTKAFSVSG